MTDVNGLPIRMQRKIQIEHLVPNGDGPCWIWTGYRDKSGYGFVHYEGRPTRSHRAVYQILVGPIPDGLQLDHLCRQRACCSPLHVEPVTPKINIRRGLRGSQTHCLRGHPLSGENLYSYADARRGYTLRMCRECRRLHDARRRSAS